MKRGGPEFFKAWRKKIGKPTGDKGGGEGRGDEGQWVFAFDQFFFCFALFRFFMNRQILGGVKSGCQRSQVSARSGLFYFIFFFSLPNQTLVP